MKQEKRVYTFGNGQAEGNAQMRELLGGKGANLAEMNHIGVPVPPGFTITTDTCNEYYKVGQEKIVELLQDEVNAAVAHTENLMRCKFGDPKNPLLVSVRSGAISVSTMRWQKVWWPRQAIPTLYMTAIAASYRCMATWCSA